MTRGLVRVVLSGALVWLTAGVVLAQTATTTQTKKFEVISVEGNQLVVKLPEGTRELTVPDDFRFNVDGKMLSVRELTPGMAGTATITERTTTIPVTVTEVKNGTVMQASGPTIIVRTDEGLIKMFSQSDIDKRGVKIMRQGKPATISDFRTNDKLSATIITTKPPRVLTEKEVAATLAKSSGAAAPPAAAATPAPATTAPSEPAPTVTSPTAATSGAEPKKLPKTASPLGALALASFASFAAGLALRVRRRRATR